MPRNKDLKRLVRARMRKTGEAYTAARAQLLKKSRAKTVSRTATTAPGTTPAAAPKPKEYAALAGMSDAAVKEKTGHTWEHWVRTLDREGAAQLPHRDIAALVSGKYKVADWWSQTVTVGYERIRGLRARGQRRDGSYEASKSRTYNVPVATLFNACADATIRRRWLNDASVKVRTATAPKSIRLGWTDRSIITVWFTPKGESKSSVAVQHTKLPDRETADRLKRYWSERLDALGEVLARR
ncbi:MAG: hypothetical protein ACREON_20210 [Gemmatimonadaceae bacterium]